MSRTRCPISASAAPRLTAVVVLPTPPFCMATAIVRAKIGPSLAEAGDSGRVLAVPKLATSRMAPVFVIPLIAGAVGGAFAAVVARQYLSRRKPYQAIWAVALAMFAAAALFETAGQAFGWSDGSYKGYYLFGGLLNVGWLGLGSLLLIASPRVGRIAMIGMLLISIVCLFAVVAAHTDGNLLKAQVPARGAIDVPSILPLITNLGGSLLLIGGAAWSAWRAARAG